MPGGSRMQRNGLHCVFPLSCVRRDSSLPSRLPRAYLACQGPHSLRLTLAVCTALCCLSLCLLGRVTGAAAGRSIAGACCSLTVCSMERDAPDDEKSQPDRRPSVYGCAVRLYWLHEAGGTEEERAGEFHVKRSSAVQGAQRLFRLPVPGDTLLLRRRVMLCLSRCSADNARC